jgi:pyruvate-formate lyase-activating enzyme
MLVIGSSLHGLGSGPPGRWSDAEDSYRHIDAANVDLKGLTGDFYHRACLGPQARAPTAVSAASW